MSNRPPAESRRGSRYSRGVQSPVHDSSPSGAGSGPNGGTEMKDLFKGSAPVEIVGLILALAFAGFAADRLGVSWGKPEHPTGDLFRRVVGS